MKRMNFTALKTKPSTIGTTSSNRVVESITIAFNQSSSPFCRMEPNQIANIDGVDLSKGGRHSMS